MKLDICRVLEAGAASSPFIARVTGHQRRSVSAMLRALERDGLVLVDRGLGEPERHRSGHRVQLYRLVL